MLGLPTLQQTDEDRCQPIKFNAIKQSKANVWWDRWSSWH